MPVSRILFSAWGVALSVVLVFCACARAGDHVPYSPDSPWNRKIGPAPVYDRNSELYVEALDGAFGIDPTRFTMPVYEVSAATPVREVRLSGVYSEVGRRGRMLKKSKEATVRVPIPDGAQSAAGSDAQIILWNPETGDEWGFWRAQPLSDGAWEAVNGYYYNTRWSGVPPFGFISRGAGVPYLTGLVRRWEIERGVIAHAIALGINYPSKLHTYPATKSDGTKMPPSLPSGARLQLDPSLTDEDFEAWGLDGPGRVIARALQDYGMIVIDSSGHPKLYAEYEGTAHWNGTVVDDTVKNIPYAAFRVLDLATPPAPSPPAGLQAAESGGAVALTWEPSAYATRYLVKRRAKGEGEARVIASWVAGTSYVDPDVRTGVRYAYEVVAVNHNGASRDSRRARILLGPK